MSDDIDHDYIDELISNAANLAAENNRLRAGLQTIIDTSEDVHSVRIAREALEQK